MATKYQTIDNLKVGDYVECIKTYNHIKCYTVGKKYKVLQLNDTRVNEEGESFYNTLSYHINYEGHKIVHTFNYFYIKDDNDKRKRIMITTHMFYLLNNNNTSSTKKEILLHKNILKLEKKIKELEERIIRLGVMAQPTVVSDTLY